MKPKLCILSIAIAAATTLTGCGSFWATTTVGPDLYLDDSYGYGYYPGYGYGYGPDYTLINPGYGYGPNTPPPGWRPPQKPTLSAAAATKTPAPTTAPAPTIQQSTQLARRLPRL